MDWRHLAACRDTDPHIFFPVGDGPLSRIETARAKRICGRCPVRAECLADALPHGIWGGLTEDDRREQHHRDAPVPSRDGPLRPPPR